AWVRRYGGSPDGGDCAQDLALDKDGNMYVTGYSSSATDFDYATIKYDSDGNVAWFARYNGPESGDDWASALSVDGFGNVYVTGHSYGSGAAEDYVTVKYVQSLRGDANADGAIDLGDVVHLINDLYKSGPAPEPVRAGDCNCDGTVEVGDVVYLINYLYRNGPAPAC
ncbi:MAG: SBBP repeat-containing protein, partial [Candidatus Zixiibacteriota bacterium]